MSSKILDEYPNMWRDFRKSAVAPRKVFHYALLRELGVTRVQAYIESHASPTGASGSSTVNTNTTWVGLNALALKLEKTKPYLRASEWIATNIDRYNIPPIQWTNREASDTLKELLEVSIYQVRRTGMTTKPLSDTILGCVKLLNDITTDTTDSSLVLFEGEDRV